MAWHPTSNSLSFTTSQGQLYRWKECIPSSYPASHGPIKKAPRLPGATSHGHADSSDASLSRSPSILSRTHRDSFFDEDEDDDFVVDDDGAGYVPSHARKRNAEWDDGLYSNKRGRIDTFRIKPHEPFQSGSTPWRGNRRYLSNFPSPSLSKHIPQTNFVACNMIGHVWTVDQDTHNTVTCEFYDREAHHQFFFTDPYLYDKACLSIVVGRKGINV